MFSRTGNERINGAISMFTKAEQDLEQGIKELEQEAATEREIINQAEENLNNISEQMQRGNRILGKVREIIR